MPVCLVLPCAWASAHVSLPAGGATAGSDYEAAFRVGHACRDAGSTTGLSIRLPEGFVLSEALPRPGWTLVRKSGEVAWTANDAGTALPSGERAEFILRGHLPDRPGPLFFKTLQTCDRGSADWAQVPAGSGASTPEFPAPRLDVLPAGVAAVDVRDAWIRPSVAGQSGTGAYLSLTAPSGARLVGASSPVAAAVEVHRMQMEGDIMRMREVPGGLELPPRQTVALLPGGYHLMMLNPTQALTQGAVVPLTLRFLDARGRRVSLDLQVPVGVPAGAQAGTGHTH